jgi:pimeloyl-ACP methyl ester carboxylesterase
VTSWLLLRGLSREQRHFGAFPSTFAARVPGAEPLCMDLAGFGTESARSSPLHMDHIVADLRVRFFKERPRGGPWSIFGLSLGGMVALRWASLHPEDFEGVVVANASTRDVAWPWERFSPQAWRKLPGLLFGDAVQSERGILELTANGQHVDRDALARAWAVYDDERRPTRMATLRQLIAAGRARLPLGLDMPVLVLASRGDRLVSWHCSRRIAERLRAPLRVHDDAGHDLTLDAPDWVCDQVAAAW